MVRFVSILILFVSVLSSHAAVLLQQTPGVLAFEAEAYTTATGTWSTITTTGGQQTLPAGTNAVGSAIYTSSGGSPSSYVTYNLSFTSDGTYYLFTKYSMYDRVSSTPPGYGNEDSFYLPRLFNQAAALGGGADTDWYTQALPSLGHLPADSPTPNPNEGKFFYWDQGQLSGSSTAPLTYTITGASEANPVTVTFTIGNRETGVAIDRFVFSTTNYNSSISSGNSTVLDGIASVPEPSRAMLLLMGCVALMRRRRKAAHIGAAAA